MHDAVDLREKPQTNEMYLIAGWRQWADAGSISSGLPRYLIKQTRAEQIGAIRPDGYYLFQFPGTHDLVRPVIRYDEGFPEALETPRNELFYSGDEDRGLAFFIGDEPHMDVEGYTRAFLDMAEALQVRRIIGLGGVYGELPYDRERMVSSSYSKKSLKQELRRLAVNLSEYHGGASIGSYVCKRAGERDMEYVSFYGFVPTYEFSNISPLTNSIRIENDFMAWLAVMKRIDHMLKLEMDLTGLQRKGKRLVRLMDAKVEELDSASPQLGIREYMARLAENFTEMPFDPLEEVWEDELRRLMDKYDEEED